MKKIILCSILLAFVDVLNTFCQILNIPGSIGTSTNGNVGIGCTDPDYLLTCTSYIKVRNSGEVGYLWGNPNNIWNLYKPNGMNDLILLSYNGAGNVMCFKADNGRVGIGTTSPYTKLDVNSVNMYVTLHNGQPQYLANWNSNGIWGIGSTDDGMNSIRIGAVNHPSMTWNPSLPINLDVQGSLSTTGTFHVSSGNNSKIDLGNWGHTFYFTDGTANRIYISTWRSNPSGNNLTRITLLDEDGVTEKVQIGSQGSTYFNGGNVGIGTTTPWSKLHLFGQGYINGVTLNRTTTVAFNINHGQIGTVETLFFDFTNNGSTWNNKMVINELGNVGIGTTQPAYKLDVLGTIRAQEVKVDMNGMADFVFDKNYNLPSLSEVEQFVKANKHLPEIPSAQEVSENGLSVGEMQNKLLQKVEELTLYMIKQQKDIEELKAKNQELEKLLNEK